MNYDQWKTASPYDSGLDENPIIEAVDYKIRTLRKRLKTRKFNTLLERQLFNLLCDLREEYEHKVSI